MYTTEHINLLEAIERFYEASQAVQKDGGKNEGLKNIRHMAADYLFREMTGQRSKLNEFIAKSNGKQGKLL